MAEKSNKCRDHWMQNQFQISISFAQLSFLSSLLLSFQSSLDSQLWNEKSADWTENKKKTLARAAFSAFISSGRWTHRISRASEEVSSHSSFYSPQPSKYQSAIFFIAFDDKSIYFIVVCSKNMLPKRLKVQIESFIFAFLYVTKMCNKKCCDGKKNYRKKYEWLDTFVDLMNVLSGKGRSAKRGPFWPRLSKVFFLLFSCEKFRREPSGIELRGGGLFQFLMRA